MDIFNFDGTTQSVALPNFLTPSIQSHIHILKLQHHAATLITLAQSIAHLLQQRSPAANRG
ncbi:hypothetical protein LC608_28600 [Nostoc sp. XA010]|uniref:hypothetical protein n=1 Tax=Nostoc sp. XA010 TaxID=2780407 RepID=UPI001E5D7216|nr:hypothetical protein [Nostoc sp. XA010]MCC5660862.1 hypothetical protein [Nostoc sp. XA010]